MISNRKARILKAVKISAKVLWWSFTVLLVILLVNILGSKIRGKVPSAFGYSVVKIVSGSMEDTIPRGSYILIKKTPPEDVGTDDIICFYSTDPVIYGVPNTHRVKEVKNEGGEYKFVTRGDANGAEDKYLAEGGRLIGVYVKTLDGLTSFSNSLSGNTLIIVIICLQICIISMVVYSVVISKDRAKGDGGDGED